MEFLNKDIYKKVHFIGINGSSMSGLAQVLLNLGFEVTGSDIEHTKTMDHLLSLGIHVYIPQDASKVGNPDLIVYTAAVNEKNCEYKYAIDNKIPLMNRKVLLGNIMDQYKYGIGVAGTHGKTTTTTFVAYLLEMCNFDPTIHIGGEAVFLDSNIKIGNSDYFVTEACEYTDTYLTLNPYIGVILNIEYDHVDYFKTFDDMKQSFLNYAKKINKDGYLIICDDDENTHFIYDKVDCNVIKYGLNNEKANYNACNISYNSEGYPTFDLYINQKMIGTTTLGMQGRHNVLNVLTAIASVHLLGGDVNEILEYVKTLSGAKRRFDVRADINGIKVIADYAHHPTAIDVTLETVNNIDHNKIWAVFEPHTFSRVKILYDDFAKCFSYADYVIMADIYDDREVADKETNSENLAKAIRAQGKDAIYLPTYQEIEDHLYENIKKGDIVMILGSKYIERVADSLATRLTNNK